jgi:hypothetical protein
MPGAKPLKYPANGPVLDEMAPMLICEEVTPVVLAEAVPGLIHPQQHPTRPAFAHVTPLFGRANRTCAETLPQ